MIPYRDRGQAVSLGIEHELARMRGAAFGVLRPGASGKFRPPLLPSTLTVGTGMIHGRARSSSTSYPYRGPSPMRSSIPATAFVQATCARGRLPVAALSVSKIASSTSPLPVRSLTTHPCRSAGDGLYQARKYQRSTEPSRLQRPVMAPSTLTQTSHAPGASVRPKHRVGRQRRVSFIPHAGCASASASIRTPGALLLVLFWSLVWPGPVGPGFSDLLRHPPPTELP
jgi:hypothetical protein